MSNIEIYTKNAKARSQQRGVLPYVVNLLEEFGTEVRCRGALRLIFDKTAIKRLKFQFGGERGLCAV